MRSPWFVLPAPRPDAALRLFCFPYAGAGASVYRGWAAELPPQVELVAVQAPGRETRLREAPLADLGDIVAGAAEAVEPYLDRPAVFFGHSMGAMVGFELARRLARRGAPEPRALIVSGRRAPHLADTDPPIAGLPDDAFVAEIQRRYGGIPEVVLQHRDLLALLLPGLRADVAALERYRHEAGEPLDCPITALGGTADPRVPRADLEAWREATRGAFAARFFAGGHFFVQSARAQVIDTVVSVLRRALAEGLEWTAA